MTGNFARGTRVTGTLSMLRGWKSFRSSTAGACAFAAGAGFPCGAAAWRGNTDGTAGRAAPRNESNCRRFIVEVLSSSRHGDASWPAKRCDPTSFPRAPPSSSVTARGGCMLRAPLARLSEPVYAIFRIVFGALFAVHGAQKVLGVLGGQTMPVGSMPWIAGVIELVGGVMIAIGLLAGLAAFIASGEMAAAYFMAHAPKNAWPHANGGELAV